MRIRQLYGDRRYVLCFAWVLAVALFSCSTASANQADLYIAWNWRNTPNWKALVDSGFTSVCIVPRAQTLRGGFAGDSLMARGVKVYLGIQPWVQMWRGVPIKDWQPDKDLWAICETDSLWLRDSTGAFFRVGPAQGVDDGFVPDFSRPEVVVAWSGVLRRYARGVAGWYMDFGDLDGYWMFPKVSRQTMDAWNAGYKAMARSLLVDDPTDELFCWCQPVDVTLCRRWSWESVGPFYGNLYSYAFVLGKYRELNRLGGQGHIFCERMDVRQYRRVTAAISLLTDATFDWRPPGGTAESYRNIEHFELDLGSAPDTCWEREPGIWQRMWTRGFVIANVTPTKWFTYKRNRTVSYVIGPGDALVVQTRDAKGRYISWLTNYGR